MIPLEGVLDKYSIEYNPEIGGNQQVLCPFHGEKNPSASVNLDEGVFNCFGCPIRGDAIRVLELVEGLEFIEAKRLAEELARGVGRKVSRKSDKGSAFLPRKSGTGRGNRKWVSPWSSR